MKDLTIKQTLLLFVILIGTGGFGLFDRLVSINTPVGIITDSILIIVLMFVFDIRKILNIKYFSSILFPFTAILILWFVKFVQNIFIDNINLAYVINNSRPFIGVLVVYLIAVNFKTIESILFVFRFMLIIAVISSLLSIFQYITGNFFETRFFRVVEDSETIRFFHRSIWLIGLMIVYLIINIFYSKRKFNIMHIFMLIVMIATIIFTLTRSVMLAILLSIASFYFILYFTSKLSIFKLLRGVSFLIITLLIITTLLNAIGYDLNALVNRFEEATDVYSNKTTDDSHSLRMEMMTMQFVNVLNDSPLSGRGMNFNVVEIENRTNYFEPFARNEDATYQNVMIYFGLAGIFFLILLHISYITSSLFVLRKFVNFKIRNLAYFVFTIPFFFVFVGFYGDYFNYNGFITFSVFSGTLYNLKQHAIQS